VIENLNQGRGEQNFIYENGNQNESNTGSSESSVEANGNVEGNNRHPHASIPGIIKRIKKGNLKVANKVRRYLPSCHSLSSTDTDNRLRFGSRWKGLIRIYE